ncbi:phospholipase D-like domain-containing protein [Ottowia caeni]|uniref:phospholipase D-like domain-containing protein n=1 Tax=Ottowia caeni TaxID=2870339 RepID=UPI003D72CCB9|nr:phospholipase D family protein [Ottowia caeni]
MLFSAHSSLLRGVGLAWLLAVVMTVLAGCAGLPENVDRPVSKALTSEVLTPLGTLVQQRRQLLREGVSGFALIDSAESAYASRLALTVGAQKTLDIQYYAIHADTSTRELLQAVQAAANRGVRVRILLDDFNSTGRNAQVMRMAFLPGVEMRMFNPLPGWRGLGVLRALGALNDFQRIQHRMHNKLFIADNAWGIAGGRNLGEAYFGYSEQSNFIDLDVLAAGPVVRQMSASFDRYWNNNLAYPVASLIRPEELRALREAETSSQDPVPSASVPAAPLSSSPLPEDLPPPMDLKELPLIWAPAELLVDQPAKLIPEENDEHTQDTVVDGLLSLIQQAKRDVLIVSPYFVPGEKMTQTLRVVSARGVRIRVLTNSLASNDAPLAHVGYARYRRELLAMGVEVHEMRAMQRQVARTVFGSSGGGSKASLHAKLVVIDGRLISIGSMNLDLRSKLQNSEVALLIRSRALSQQAIELVQKTLDEGAWRLNLDEEGNLNWKAPPGADFEDALTEPDASLVLRLILQLLGPFAPDEML